MPSYGAERALVGHALESAKGPRLDLSCGPGTFTEEFCGDDPISGVIGVDLSPAMLRGARRRAPHALLVRADATHLPFPDATFGAACNMAALDLYSQPGRALAELARVLRPRAAWILSVFTWPRVLAPLRWVRSQRSGSGPRALARTQVTDMIRRAGLTCETEHRFGTYWVFAGHKP